MRMNKASRHMGETAAEALDALLNCSLYRTPPEMMPQDRLLKLVACEEEMIFAVWCQPAGFVRMKTRQR